MIDRIAESSENVSLSLIPSTEVGKWALQHPEKIGEILGYQAATAPDHIIAFGLDTVARSIYLTHPTVSLDDLSKGFNNGLAIRAGVQGNTARSMQYQREWKILVTHYGRGGPGNVR